MKKLIFLFTLTAFFTFALVSTTSAHAASPQSINSESAKSTSLIVSKTIGVGGRMPITIGPIRGISPCQPLPTIPVQAIYGNYSTSISGFPLCRFGSEPGTAR